MEEVKTPKRQLIWAKAVNAQPVKQTGYGPVDFNKEIHVPTEDPANANLVSSRTPYPGMHAPVIDMDKAGIHIVPSTKPGNVHLYIDRLVDWYPYSQLLKALFNCGLIEKTWYQNAIARQATFVRPPWVKKGQEVPPPAYYLDALKNPPKLYTMPGGWNKCRHIAKAIGMPTAALKNGPPMGPFEQVDENDQPWQGEELLKAKMYFDTASKVWWHVDLIGWWHGEDVLESLGWKLKAGSQVEPILRPPVGFLKKVSYNWIDEAGTYWDKGTLLHYAGVPSVVDWNKKQKAQGKEQVVVEEVPIMDFPMPPHLPPYPKAGFVPTMTTTAQMLDTKVTAAMIDDMKKEMLYGSKDIEPAPIVVNEDNYGFKCVCGGIPSWSMKTGVGHGSIANCYDCKNQYDAVSIKMAYAKQGKLSEWKKSGWDKAYMPKQPKVKQFDDMILYDEEPF